MSAWSDGYVSDINYTYGYYTELNPTRVVAIFDGGLGRAQGGGCV